MNVTDDPSLGIVTSEIPTGMTNESNPLEMLLLSLGLCSTRRSQSFVHEEQSCASFGGHPIVLAPPVTVNGKAAEWMKVPPGPPFCRCVGDQW